VTDTALITDADFDRETLQFLPDLLRFAKSLTRNGDEAQDLVQDTFLRAYRSRATFQLGSTRQWLFTICRNVFLRSREREKWTVEVEDDAQLEILATVHLHKTAKRDGYDDVWTQIDFGPALERAMAKLPEPFRVVFALVDVGDQSYAEVAEALDVPIGTVRSRLFRARRELQSALIDFARDAGVVTGGARTTVHKERTR
jgi:RNA polymerase sigma-70 factor (ECF subfamily)